MSSQLAIRRSTQALATAVERMFIQNHPTNQVVAQRRKDIVAGRIEVPKRKPWYPLTVGSQMVVLREV